MSFGEIKKKKNAVRGASFRILIRTHCSPNGTSQGLHVERLELSLGGVGQEPVGELLGRWVLVHLPDLAAQAKVLGACVHAGDEDLRAQGWVTWLLLHGVAGTIPGLDGQWPP